MSWINLHSHSTFCDGKADPEAFIKVAIKNEFKAYGYSSHAPVNFASAWNMKQENLDDYLKEIKRIRSVYSDRIEIYVGLEQDYLSGMEYSGFSRASFDYIIGSIHYIGQFHDGTHFCFDGQSELFFKGIQDLFQNDFRKAITTYFELSMNMVEKNKPDIIGHLDKIKMHNDVRNYLNEDDKWYVDLINDLLDVVKKNNCIAEINTRGTYKRFPPVLYPGAWVLRRLYEKEIPVMISSDAHDPSEIDLGFKTTAHLLKETGFRTMRTLYHGKWQDLAFSESGFDL